MITLHYSLFSSFDYFIGPVHEHNRTYTELLVTKG